MQTFFSVLLLIIGLVIGTRIGLRGLFMFWVVIGMIYGLIKIPLAFYRFSLDRISGSAHHEIAAILLLIMCFLGLLWGAIQLGAMIFEELELDVLPPGIDHALGGAVGGALGWVLIELMLG